MFAGGFGGSKSSNRIELSQFIQKLLHFFVISLSPCGLHIPLVPTLSPCCLHIVPTWSPHPCGPDIVPHCLHVVYMLFPHCLHIVPMLSPCCPHVVPMLSPHCPHTITVIPLLFPLSPSSPHHRYGPHIISTPTYPLHPPPPPWRGDPQNQ